MAWKEQIPFLAKRGFHVIAPDMRGYNLSARPAGVEGYHPLRVAEDISVLMKTLVPGEKAAIIGHDWGANIAWILAMAHPEQVERLSTMAAGHPADYDFKKFDREQRKKSWYISMMALPMVPEFLLSVGDHAMLKRSFNAQGVDHEDTEMFVSVLRKNPEALEAMVNYYRAAARSPSKEFRPVEVPVLAIHGDKDQETGERLMTTSKDLAPNFQPLEKIQGGGHWLQIAPSSAPRVNEALAKFLSAMQ